MLGAGEEETSGAGGKIATCEVTKLYSAVLFFSFLIHFHFHCEVTLLCCWRYNLFFSLSLFTSFSLFTFHFEVTKLYSARDKICAFSLSPYTPFFNFTLLFPLSLSIFTLKSLNYTLLDIQTSLCWSPTQSSCNQCGEGASDVTIVTRHITRDLPRWLNLHWGKRLTHKNFRFFIHITEA